VTANSVKVIGLVALMALSAGCGEFTREGRAPVIVVIRSLQGASGATPDELGGTLNSDVITGGGTINDVGEVEMSLIAKDPGVPGIGSNPSLLNSVTINRYRVSYRRTDGRSAQGVDVPYTFDSAITFTVPPDGVVTAGFELVRHSAKEEAPLRALSTNGSIISAIADVTFYGRDQTGNDVSATGSIGIDFGDFADPQ